MKKTTDSQSKYWCFTINNYDEEAVQDLLWPSESNWFKVPKYLVAQPEEGEQGTKHIQGYVVFENRVRFSQVRKQFGDKAHLEIRRGTHAEAKAYCKKIESYDWCPLHDMRSIEFGDDTGLDMNSGERTDLTVVKRDIDAGMSTREVWSNHFTSMVKYFKGFDRYMHSINPKRRTEMPEVYVFWGKSGSGKSKQAYEMTEGLAYYKNPTNKWWDGFEAGYEDVIVDDYRGAWGEEYILSLCDRYPLNYEIKGGTIEIQFKRIFFTTNIHPKAWSGWGFEWDWDNTTNPHPFKRRIKELKEFT